MIERCGPCYNIQKDYKNWAYLQEKKNLWTIKEKVSVKSTCGYSADN